MTAAAILPQVIAAEGPLQAPGESAAAPMVAMLRRQEKVMRLAIDALDEHAPDYSAETAQQLLDDYIHLTNLAATLGHVFADAMRYGMIRRDLVAGQQPDPREGSEYHHTLYHVGVRGRITGTAIDRVFDVRLAAGAQPVGLGPERGVYLQPSRGGA